MRRESSFLDTFKIDDTVAYENSGPDGFLRMPSGGTLRMTEIQWKVLAEFKRPTTAARVGAIVPSDQERTILRTNLERWIDLKILLPSEMRYGCAPVVMLNNPSCSDLYFTFAGSQGGMMMNPFQFLQETGLDRQNTVLLRDPYQTWFLNGIGGEMGSVRELVAWQLGYVKGQAHVANHYCLGSSMGAFSAVLFGHFLKATAVWAFGLTRTTVSLFDNAARSWNLETMLAEGNGVTRFYLYFNESWTEDREAAHRLRHLPGVELRPQSGDGHLVLLTLQSSGLLSSILPKGRSVGNGSENTSVGEHEVLDVLRSVLPHACTALSASTPLEGILESFGLVSLLETLSRDFGVDLDPSRLRPQDFESATAIAAAIGRERRWT
jgi:hypothetical protein